MTDIIGKALDEIRSLDIDVDELSDREVSYILALALDFNFTTSSVSITGGFKEQGRQWPDYKGQPAHAWDLFNSIPFERQWDDDAEVYFFWPESSPIAECWRAIESNEYDSMKYLAESAAKCVIEGIELEVSE